MSPEAPAESGLPTPLRFLLAGAFAAAVNFGARIALSIVLPFPAAIVLAYACGMATAFILTRRYVFQPSASRLHQQIFWFVAVNMFALVQTVAVSLVLADWLLPRMGLRTHVEALAHAIGIAVPMFTSYVGHKRLSFR